MENRKTKKIGIMGGTFDPIHYGHLLIAQSAADEYDLDQVIFIPNGQPPHKDMQTVTDGNIRCIMVQKAIADNPCFQLSKLEIVNTEVNYTYQTLQKIEKSHPESELYFIMGEDSLKDFEGWREPALICQLATILVAVRDDIQGKELEQYMQHLKQLFQAHIFKLHSPNYSVSSRNIRARIQSGKSVRYLLPEPVKKYIESQNLYRDMK